MIIFVNSEDVYPSLDALGELGIDYKMVDDSRIAVKLKARKIRVAENQDMTYLLSKNSEEADKSLAYFVIDGHRIIASGNLQKIDKSNYICDGAFRVFSRVNVTTYDYIAASQIDVSELFALNKWMLDSTSKNRNIR